MKQDILLGILTLTLLFICSSVCVQAQPVKETIKPKKFERLMKKPSTVIIDVRTAEEFNTGHIPGAINIDVKSESFLQQIKSLDSTNKYLLYCRSGKRSQTALNLMRANGFTQTLHLKGGIEAWKGRKE